VIAAVIGANTNAVTAITVQKAGVDPECAPDEELQRLVMLTAGRDQIPGNPEKADNGPMTQGHPGELWVGTVAAVRPCMRHDH
jgi:hypothetical protein